MALALLPVIFPDEIANQDATNKNRMYFNTVSLVRNKKICDPLPDFTGFTLMSIRTLGKQVRMRAWLQPGRAIFNWVDLKTDS